MAGVAAVFYAKRVRPAIRNWGATETEVGRAMPLDSQVSRPDLASTRAITIDASPDRVWPWVVQMGERPRAGFYSYAWIERAMGLKIENSERILPEYQVLAVGDAVDRKSEMVVRAIEPGSFVVFGPPDSIDWLKSTWAFGLYPEDGGRTRLVTRVRSRFTLPGMTKGLRALLSPLWAFMDAGVFVMEREMLLGLKRRAEAAPDVAAGHP